MGQKMDNRKSRIDGINKETGDGGRKAEDGVFSLSAGQEKNQSESGAGFFRKELSSVSNSLIEGKLDFNFLGNRKEGQPPLFERTAETRDSHPCLVFFSFRRMDRV